MTILAILFFLSTVFFAIPWIKTRVKVGKYLKHYVGPESKLEVCYTDALGNKWYKWKSQLDMAPLRAFRVEVATKMANLGLTEAIYDMFMDRMVQAVNRNDLQKVGELLGRMKQRRELAAEEKSLQALANVYFLLEGENPKEPSDFWFGKKKEIWEKDPECYAFFLIESFRSIRSISGLSSTDLLDYIHSTTQSAALSRI